eukprot:scaffold153864_cov31-Tisochrysis_lutea.AAC.1
MAALCDAASPSGHPLVWNHLTSSRVPMANLSPTSMAVSPPRRESVNGHNAVTRAQTVTVSRT